MLDLVTRLSAGWRVTILAPHGPGAVRSETVGGVTIHRFRYLPERWEALAYGGGIAENLRNNRWLHLAVPFFFLAQLLAVARLLRRDRVDVIHAHWWLPQGISAVLARCAARRRAIPIVCTLHGADVYAFGHGVMAHVMRWVLLRCEAVCPVSDAVRDALPACVARAGEITVAPMGVDLVETFRPRRAAPRDAAAVVFVGRLVAKKGVDWLIRAFAHATAQAPALTLRIVGDGPLRPSSEALAHELGLSSRVRFDGVVGHERLPDLFSQAAIAVVPSVVAASGDREGLGLTAIEAQGCECAVIVSDTPSLVGVVRDRETGLIVPQGDVQALAAAIVELASDETLRTALARAGRESALDEYDWSVSAERYAKLFERIAG